MGVLLDEKLSKGESIVEEGFGQKCPEDALQKVVKPVFEHSGGDENEYKPKPPVM